MSKFKSMFNKVTATITKGINKYDQVTNKVEIKIMKKCGSDKTMDEAIDNAACKAVDKVKTIAPMVKCIPAKVKAVLPTRKVDPITKLAQDAELAAVLKWMYVNPYIKVDIRVIQEPVKPVVIDSSVPLARVHINENIAPMHGVYGEHGLCPASPSAMSRLGSLVRTATGAPMAICIAPNN